jgi:hypothetical protein
MNPFLKRYDSESRMLFRGVQVAFFSPHHWVRNWHFKNMERPFSFEFIYALQLKQSQTCCVVFIKHPGPDWRKKSLRGKLIPSGPPIF